MWLCPHHFLSYSCYALGLLDSSLWGTGCGYWSWWSSFCSGTGTASYWAPRAYTKPWFNSSPTGITLIPLLPWHTEGGVLCSLPGIGPTSRNSLTNWTFSIPAGGPNSKSRDSQGPILFTSAKSWRSILSPLRKFNLLQCSRKPKLNMNLLLRSTQISFQCIRRCTESSRSKAYYSNMPIVTVKHVHMEVTITIEVKKEAQLTLMTAAGPSTVSRVWRRWKLLQSNKRSYLRLQSFLKR